MDEKYMLIPASGVMTKVAVNEIMSCNKITARYGLELSEAEACELMATHANALRSNGRIELSGGVIGKLIMAFCDSPFISQYHYAETMSDLVETFYYFKNETLDELDDDDLISAMKAYFNKNCQGSMELLQNRELETLARCIRFGVSADQLSDEDEYEEDD